MGIISAARTRVGSPPRARTLLDIFSATTARCADRTALDAPDATLTYAELRQAAGALAERLHADGIGVGDRVAVRVPSGTAQLYIAILGVLFAGAAYVPIDAEDPPARARDILHRAAVRAEITAGLRIELISMPEPPRAAVAGPAAGDRREAAGPDDDAWVIFTSGSTGRPKGVAVTHRSAAAFVDAEAKLWTVEPEDRVLAGLSVAFDASCEEMWLAWRHGAALVPAPRDLVRAGEELGEWLIERDITVVSTVPTLAAMWDESCLSRVRLLILGGEACPESLGWRLAAGREVWNTYGPTEATVVSTAAPIVPGEPVTIGWPLPGWEIAVLDGEQPAALGEPGELVIAGVGLGRYLDAALDAERYAPVPALGWERAYRTGDIVRATAAGLEFVGRRDDQVKIGGRRIELGELEAALAQAPGVVAAAAAVRESAAGNKLLVGYVVGEADPAAVRAAVGKRLPAGIVPLVVNVAELPRATSGKVDRNALPWPVGGDVEGRAAGIGADGSTLTDTEVWLAERWTEQLGPVPVTPHSDFFALGGASIAAAKLVSVLRARYPTVAVADVYRHPTLRSLAQRLDALGAGERQATESLEHAHRAWGLLQIVGVLALLAVSAPGWVFGILAVGHWYHIGPQLAWGWIALGLIVLSSVPARVLFAAAARRVLLRGVEPGRYPRHGWTAFRVMFLDRLGEVCHLTKVAGTPWAVRYARLSGHRIGTGARLWTMPPASAMLTVGEGATIESHVDIRGFCVEGDELIVGEIEIGPRARIAARVALRPGASVGAGAEVEPASVVRGRVPAGERWSGVPAVRVGLAGEGWPAASAPAPRRPGLWSLMTGLGIALDELLLLLAAAPGIALVFVVEPVGASLGQLVRWAIFLAPALTLSFVALYALLAALVVRGLGRLIRPGLHAEVGATAWALWLGELIMDSTRNALFPLYASSFTRRWLRLCGVDVGRGAELSTIVGANRLTRIGATSFAADDVMVSCMRMRDGWIEVRPTSVGERTFLGNHSFLAPGSRIGSDCLIGVLSTAPSVAPDGTSWLGSPALELPRRPLAADPSRTVNPPRSLRAARRVMDIVRILVPATVAIVLGDGIYGVLESIGAHDGIGWMLGLTTFVLFGAGVVAALTTVAIKWIVMGRYRAGDRPFYSFYVWRDEIVNSCQERIAAPFLLKSALGTPLVPAYLRLMGTRVGRGVWIENLNTTEFDLVTLGDGCALGHGSVVQTHTFHDRVLSTGPAVIGAGATLGPDSATLPDTAIGERTVVGYRSVVMRGEELPAGTRWHGVPVAPAGR